MALVDIKNYLQGLLTLGYGNTSQTPIPTSAFPMDGRTYFESLEQAQAAALLAEQQGSKNTIFYFGMTLVVFENDVVKEYIIVKDATTGKGALQEKNVATDTPGTNPYVLPIATTTKLGGIKVGANLTMAPDGTLSAISSSDVEKYVDEGLAGKVDKVSGKGLSSNDFTNEYKSKIDDIDLSIIANAVQKTVDGNVKIDNALILTDSTSGKEYKIYINDGKLQLEEVN